MRRAQAADTTGVSLFPCLAVMLSLTGVMIVVLVVMARYAALDAAQGDISAPAAAIAAREREAFQSQFAKLEEVRGGLQAKLDRRRQELGYVEHERRELERKALELHSALEEQRRLVAAGQKQRDDAKADIERLKQAVAEAATALKDMAKNVTGRQPSYSVVPYEGPSHTRRRPIYIECAKDRVILQPEGVVLGDDDFDGPLDAGNPLASALRATREYLDQQRKLTGEDPYPLLLIRPDGVPAYYAVRQAIADWGAEFGYELIEQDWKLKFPPADPTLTQIQSRVVEESRQRQRLLAARSKRAVTKRKTYVVAPSGGIVQDRGGAGLGDPALPYDPEADSRDGERIARGGPLNPNQGHEHGTTSGGKMPGSYAVGKGKYGEGQPNTKSARSIETHATGSHARESHATGSHATGARTTGPLESPPLRGDTTSSGPLAGPMNSADRGNGTRESGIEVADNEPRIGESRLDQPTPEGGPNSQAGPNSQGDDQPNRTAAAKASRVDPRARASSGTFSAKSAPDDPKNASLAKSRGKNWGIQHVARGSIPITRPVRVLCYEDRALIAPIDDTYEAKAIPFAGDTRDSVDPIVAAVWEQTKQWGIAGKGMYWRPVLSIDVQPGGQDRYLELRRLLDDSGLVVRRKGEADIPAAQQNVNRETNPKR